MTLRALWLLVAPLLVSLLVLATAPGCDDGGDADSDSDQDTDQDEDWDLDIEAPAPPAPPVLTPCPDGWREVPPEDPSDPYDVATCDPWPEGGMQECEGAEAHFPGEPGCRRIGSECPEGEWAEGLPETGVLYVRAGASSGGAGTRESPLGTIAEATAVAAAGATIALSRGRYDRFVSLPAGVTLRGACVAETILTWGGTGDLDRLSTVTARGAGAAVRDLTITGEWVGVRVVGDEATLDLRGVLVSEARRAGLWVEQGAGLTGSDVVVRRTRSMAEPDPEITEAAVTHGYGLGLRGGGRAELDRVVVAANHRIGVVAFGPGTVVRLSDAAIVDTEGQELDGTDGYGFAAADCDSAELRRTVVERNRMIGVMASGQTTSFEAQDLVVRDNEGRQSDGMNGNGIWVQLGAALRVSRGLVERNRQGGIQVWENAGGSITLEDLVVRDTRSAQANGWGGFGMTATGAQLEGRRLLFRRNRLWGALIAGSTATLTDIVVLETETPEVPAWSSTECGLGVCEGAQVDLSRAAVERNRVYGVCSWHSGTDLRATDVTIRDTLQLQCPGDWRCQEFASFGTGATAACGSHMDLTRFRVSGSPLCGIQLVHMGDASGAECLGGTADLHDGEVSDNLIGVNITTPGFDIHRLMDHVIYRDNGRNLDTAELPVPDMALPPEW